MLIVMREKHIGKILLGGVETVAGSGAVVYGSVEAFASNLPDQVKAGVLVAFGLLFAVGGVSRVARGFGNKDFLTVPQMLGKAIQLEEETIASFSESGFKGRPVARLRHRVANRLQGNK